MNSRVLLIIGAWLLLVPTLNWLAVITGRGVISDVTKTINGIQVDIAICFLIAWMGWEDKR